MPSFASFRSSILIASILALLFLGAMSCNGSGDNHNEELIARMQEATDKVIETTHVPGIVALVADHSLKINWVYTAGVSDIPNSTPANASYTFRVGSNTKTFVVTVLLQLVAEGKISLDDKLSNFFPEFQNANKITIAMLCNMTSGIPNYTEDDYFLDRMLNHPKRVWSPLELVRIGINKEFSFEPGTSWKYSNTNTILLGMIIEKLTQNSLQREIGMRVVDKLGLRQTDFLTSGTELPGIHGRGYYEGEYVQGVDMTEHYDISWGWAAGSVYSTPLELQKYVEAMVGGGLLPDDIQTRRFSEHIVHFDENIAYGLGILKRGTFYGHNGSLPGFTTSMYHSPEKNCTVIISFNSQLEDTIPDQLFDRFVEILYGGNY